MDLHDFAEQIFLSLPYDPNEQQIQLIAALARFCSPQMPSDSVFLLNGYAGTGKTSVTGALVQALRGSLGAGGASGSYRQGCQGVWQVCPFSRHHYTQTYIQADGAGWYALCGRSGRQQSARCGVHSGRGFNDRR